jgi:hypothetical protein
MLREKLIYITTGLASAMLFLSLLFGNQIGFLPAYFSPLPILIIGLSKGINPTIISTISGFFCALFIADIFQAMLFGITIAIPALLIVRYTTMTKTVHGDQTKRLSIGEIIARLATFGGFIFILTAVIYSDTHGSLAKFIETFLNRVITTSLYFGAPTQHQTIINNLVPLFPAIVIASWLLMSLINSALSQLILFKTSRNLRPPIEYSQITLPEWIYWLIVCSGAIALISSGDFEYILRNLTFIFAIPFFLVGLAVFHNLASRLRTPYLALVTFYLFLAISAWAIFLVTIIGFFEEWTQFRNKSQLAQTKNKNK